MAAILPTSSYQFYQLDCLKDCLEDFPATYDTEFRRFLDLCIAHGKQTIAASQAPKKPRCVALYIMAASYGYSSPVCLVCSPAT